MTLDAAKKQYAAAWAAYKETWDDGERLRLGKAMDSAQNHFTWQQFQEFKVTLPGFIEYWAAVPSMLAKQLRDRNNR